MLLILLYFFNEVRSNVIGSKGRGGGNIAGSFRSGCDVVALQRVNYLTRGGRCRLARPHLGFTLKFVLMHLNVTYRIFF